jgi:hypothetical protein
MLEDREKLPNLRLWPEVVRELEMKGEQSGYSLQYYLLYLIGKDLGYLKPGATVSQTKVWLKVRYPLKLRKASKATRALFKLGGGPKSTSDVADKASLNYQQAYRQLSRDPNVVKRAGGWVIDPRSRIEDQLSKKSPK